MKIQDIVFLVCLTVLCMIRKDRWALYIGLLCFLAAIPLFYGWIFFTGERLTWYGVAFIAMYIGKQIVSIRKESKNI